MSTTELFAVLDPHTGVVRGNSRGLMVRFTGKKARQLAKAHPLHDDDTRQLIRRFVPETELEELRSELAVALEDRDDEREHAASIARELTGQIAALKEMRDELRQQLTDVRRAERKRCKQQALRCVEYFDLRSHDVENRTALERADDLVRATACGHVAAAIEALGDDDA